MRLSVIGIALCATLGWPAASRAEPLAPSSGWSEAPGLVIPGVPPFPLPPGASVLRPDGPVAPVPDLGPDVPRGPAAAARQPEGKETVPRDKPPSGKDAVDALFVQLGKAKDPDEARGIASAIERLWMHSGSDTTDLLMQRAVTALNAEHRDVALEVLDKVVAIRPDWAEGWNKRATVRFLDDDDNGSMEDIAHVLLLEPRHFGALSGMAVILKRHGLAKAALKALRRAGEIDPGDEGIRKEIERLTPEVDGRDL